LDKTQSREL